jgi:putative spermidine/putrescine transport system permease protein
VIRTLIRALRRLDPGALLLRLHVALFVLFIAAPIVSVVAVSFSTASFIVFPIPGYGMRWYWRIIEYRPFIDSLLVSIEVALLSAGFAAALGVPAALALARSRSGLAETGANFLLAPISVPAIVLGFSLLYYLSALGLGLSFLSLLVAHTVAGIPYIARTVLATYRSVPPQFEEAASILGGPASSPVGCSRC